MAASVPPLFKGYMPITPPPDLQMLLRGPLPQLPGHFAQGHHQTSAATTSKPTTQQGTHIPLARPFQPSNIPNPPAPPPTLAIKPEQPPTTLSTAASPAPKPTATTPQQPPQTQPQPQPPLDPRYIAMAARLAAHYQQRCQAVAAYQHQRCQAWAAAHRKQCEDTMQAATAVVAWYIRDRISRRRRRRRRAFKRGLRAREADAAVGSLGVGVLGAGVRRSGKGEAVRRWVMNVPIKGEKTGGVEGRDDGRRREGPLDREEAEFDMDRDIGVEKDAELFTLANDFIKSHLARTNVPLLGALSFDESDSESESGEEEEDMMDFEGGGDGEEDAEEYDDDEECDDDGEGDEIEEDNVGGEEGKEELASVSKDAELGTTAKGSRKPSRSSVS